MKNMTEIESSAPGSKKPIYISLCTGFAVGVLAAYSAIMFFPFHGALNTIRVLRESDISSSSPYTFTDPLVSVSVTDNTASSQDAVIQQKIQNYIQSQKNNGVSSFSVNFRDIDNSDGFNINPSILYDPASLTKIPLMMAYY